MILLTAQQLTKAFGARPLFSGLSFTIESGERIGLIGPNGAGKSTLLRILAGQTSPDDGQLSTQRGLRVGFLEQAPTFSPEVTIHDCILGGSEDPDDWESIARAQEFTSRFELDSFDPATPVTRLSGGWQKRVALARQLMNEPDLLLLDEPTNHLDVESILWLEDFLTKAPFAVMTVTHDRLFLQRIANRILELDPRHEGGLLSIKGDYAHYLEAREALISAQERREIILKNTLRRETEWLRRGAKARTTKQQARIQRHGALESEVEELSTRNVVRTARLDFQTTSRSPKKLIEAEKISKSYGDKKIFEDVDLLISPGTRLGILGRNGSGKSTLIRVLLRQEEPTHGRVRHAENFSVAYFDQIREALDPDLTVSKTLCPSGEFVDFRGARIHIRSYLDRFLFSQQQMDMPVRKLSGGEQSRLLLARLMLTEANLLVLDEPTNDLDMATLTVLEECLVEFGGAVILVSHDRYFLDQVATRILAFPPVDTGDSRLTSFADLSQWEQWHEQQTAQAAKKNSPRVEKVSEPAPAKRKKLGFKEQRELDSMEENIQKAEARLARLTEECALPENAGNALALARLTEQMAEAQREVDRLYQRWSELE